MVQKLEQTVPISQTLSAQDVYKRQTLLRIHQNLAVFQRVLIKFIISLQNFNELEVILYLTQ